jgi:hypothetical protein
LNSNQINASNEDTLSTKTIIAKAQGAFNDENPVAMKSAKRSGVSRQHNRIKNATGQAQVERESLT